MEELKGQIVSHYGKLPQATYEGIKNDVETWIKQEQSLLFLANQASYTVTFNDEDQTDCTCHIEIAIGSGEWAGNGLGHSIQEAAAEALSALKSKNAPGLFHYFFPSPAERVIA